MVDQASINLLEPLLADAELLGREQAHVNRGQTIGQPGAFFVCIPIQQTGTAVPEGPEIHRVAARLNEALGGKTPDAIRFHYPPIARKARTVRGQAISRVRSHGKALLIDFSNGLTLYSHNQLYGLWYIGQPANDPFTHRQLRVEIRSLGVIARLYSASSIELWRTDRLHQHPFYPN